jgi:hypothetical protein
MKNFVFALLANGVQYATVSGTPSDVHNEYVKADQLTYNTSKITKKKIGVRVASRVIYFKDLLLNNEKELSSLSDNSLLCLLGAKFTNDNITYFLEERGLIIRTVGFAPVVTAKGKELIEAYLK